MYERVNPSHPDKIADRIAGAIVDLAYQKQENPKVAVEVLVGHGVCNVIIESSVEFQYHEVFAIASRIVGHEVVVRLISVPQDPHLAANQDGKIRCGDNGIFKGVPMSLEHRSLTALAKRLYEKYPTDGKFILDGGKLIICQSCVDTQELKKEFPSAVVNPLGDWTGGIDVDSGATNRKLGSDMGESVTGGGLFGKDCSKADVSVNIYAWLKAQRTNSVVNLSCAIGDEIVDNRPYSEIVAIAKEYIDALGGFEKFAEWGLVEI